MQNPFYPKGGWFLAFFMQFYLVGVLLIVFVGVAAVQFDETLAQSEGRKQAELIYHHPPVGTPTPIKKYAHLANPGAIVNVGDNVTKGQPIGTMGNTG